VSKTSDKRVLNQRRVSSGEERSEVHSDLIQIGYPCVSLPMLERHTEKRKKQIILTFIDICSEEPGL